MGNNSRGAQAVKAGIGYTIGNILVKGISFISIPVFAKLLSVADYGIVNTFTAYSSIFFIIVGLALHSSVKNANLDYPDKINEYCSSMTILTIGTTLFFFLIAVCFGNPLSDILSLDHPILLSLIVIDSFCLAMISYYNSVLAVNYYYKEYLALSLIYSIFGIGLSIFLILKVFSSDQYLGRILGTLISSAFVTVFILYRLYKKARPKVNTVFWKYGLKISLPIVPHGLSQLILSQFDRLMIKSTIGNVEAGLYSFAYTLGTIYQVVANSLDTAFSQWFFDQMAVKDYGKIRKISNYYIGILALGAVSLMLISPELIFFMGGDKYESSRFVTLPIVLSMFYAAMYTLPAAVEYYYKKTKLIAVATAIAAVLNVILNLIFIPRYGYTAAAYTTVVCYLIYYIIHMIFSFWIHGAMIYDLKCHILCMVMVTAAVFLCQALICLTLIRIGILITGFLVLGMIGVKNRKALQQSLKSFRSK